MNTNFRMSKIKLYKTAKTKESKDGALGWIPANTYVSISFIEKLWAYDCTDARGNHALYYFHELKDFWF